MSGEAAHTFVANIPASVRSKQKLLRILADQLQFPAYFGNNWDALEECLRDLSWLPAGNIEIHHRDIPLPLAVRTDGLIRKFLRPRLPSGRIQTSVVWSVSFPRIAGRKFCRSAHKNPARLPPRLAADEPGDYKRLRSDTYQVIHLAPR